MPHMPSSEYARSSDTQATETVAPAGKEGAQEGGEEGQEGEKGEEEEEEEPQVFRLAPYRDRYLDVDPIRYRFLEGIPVAGGRWFLSNKPRAPATSASSRNDRRGRIPSSLYCISLSGVSSAMI